MEEHIDSITYTSDELGDKLWQVVGEQIRLLCKANYNVVVREEEIGIVVIEFQSANEKLGYPSPHWLTEEDICKLSDYDDEEE